MEFRTTVKTGENRGWLQHSDHVMLLGSCFSDNIGGKMHGALINAMVNPMGTLYNPMSIACGVQRLIDCEPVAGKDLFMQGGVWNSYDFHSRYSLPDKQAAIDRMNSRIEQGHKALAAARLLTVTLGTAMVYRLKATGEVVANCHKVPQHEFERKMATVQEMVQVLDDMVHPSDVAVEYIWQAFQATYLDDRSALAVARCERVHKRLQHRPMSTSRETVDRFNADTVSVVRNLIKEYPYLANNHELQQVIDRQ